MKLLENEKNYILPFLWMQKSRKCIFDREIGGNYEIFNGIDL